jgi:hypothetical protein
MGLKRWLICASDGKQVSIEGMQGNDQAGWEDADDCLAGSALIQACEKAGSVIPR